MKTRCSVKLQRSRTKRLHKLMALKPRKGTSRKRAATIKKLKRQIAACR